MNKKQVLQGIGAIVAIMFIICVIPDLISGDTQILTVMSDSMSPDINAGDMVIIRSVDSDGIKVGDIITYAPRTYGIVVTHRVVGIDDAGNFVMKGDANTRNDINTVKPEQVIGRCELTIPYFGYVTHYIRQPIGFMILIVIPALLLLGMEIKNVITCGRNETNDQTDR